jgi:glutamate 5-kinase
MKTDRESNLDNAKRVIVKVGSSVLSEKDRLNMNTLNLISGQICELINGGREVILVTSGAMAEGIRKIGLPGRPESIPQRQAVAAVGQAGLIMEYEKAFAKYHKKVAQMLLTSAGLIDRKRYLNARNTLSTLLSWNIVPIINENDTVAVEELKFGDNDNLAAMITILMDADILISLTDIDGLYNMDPRTNPAADFVQTVSCITGDTEKCASEIPGALGLGGMLGKIMAAKKVTAAGIPMVIASGMEPDILTKLFQKQPYGTYFEPKQEKLASRKCWIAFTLTPEGALTVDTGAAEALLKKGKSLLSCGIINVKGAFNVGAPIEFKQKDGKILGKGLVNYSADDIRKIMGLNTDRIIEHLGYKPYDEVIHRDNLVITAE